jgi:hypothetical protein
VNSKGSYLLLPPCFLSKFHHRWDFPNAHTKRLDRFTRSKNDVVSGTGKLDCGLLFSSFRIKGQTRIDLACQMRTVTGVPHGVKQCHRPMKLYK